MQSLCTSTHLEPIDQVSIQEQSSVKNVWVAFCEGIARGVPANQRKVFTEIRYVTEEEEQLPTFG